MWQALVWWGLSNIQRILLEKVLERDGGVREVPTFFCHSFQQKARGVRHSAPAVVVGDPAVPADLRDKQPESLH